MSYPRLLSSGPAGAWQSDLFGKGHPAKPKAEGMALGLSTSALIEAEKLHRSQGLLTNFPAAVEAELPARRRE